MATALMAINIVSGCGGDSCNQGGFAVDDCATRDPEAARERFKADYFIMDIFDPDYIHPRGRNAARLYNIDVDAVRCTVPADKLMEAKAAYPDVAQPSLRKYGFKTRREFFKFAFTGKNPLA